MSGSLYLINSIGKNENKPLNRYFNCYDAVDNIINNVNSANMVSILKTHGPLHQNRSKTNETLAHYWRLMENYISANERPRKYSILLQYVSRFPKMSLLETIEFYYNMFPDTRYSGIYQFNIPTLIIKDPELLKQLTVRDFDHFTDHRTLVDADLDPLWAGNLFALTGRKWKDMRATLSGSFSSSKIKNMFHFINGTAENFVTFFLNKNEKLIEVEIRDTFSRFANDIIATTAFGIEVDSLKSPNNPFHLLGKRITDYSSLVKRLRFFAILIMPKLTKFFNIGLFDKELSSFFYKIREEKEIVRRDMLNTLLEARKGIHHEYSDAIETGQGIDFANLTDADLAAQAMVFYLAGFDTISNAMCFGSYELAVNKEIQNKLRSEIVETHRLNGGKVTYDSVLKMKYMDKVISEILRKWPPAGVVDRVATKPYTIEPQSTPWPIVGDLWTNIFWQMSLLETIEFSYNMFPGVRYSGFYQFSIPTLIIKDPELLKQLTIRDFDHFTDHRTLIDADVDPLWAGHLFALTGRKWKDMRATLSGSFSSSKIKNLFNLMNGAAENFVTFFLNKNEKLIVLEMRDTFSRFANDIIATTAFGIEVDSLKSPNNPFHLLGKRITDYSSLVKRLRFFAILIMPKLTKLLKIGLFEKELSSFFYKTVKETIHAREEQGIVRQDMLNVLLEARKGIQHEYSDAIETGFATVKEYTHSGKGPQFANLTDADLAAQAMIFYLAGFDTISNAMSFGSYELAINKKIQNKLRSEIVETHKLNDGKITYDSLLKIQYMDKVISEILRKWPPVGISDRVATKPYTIEPVNANEKPLNLKIGDVVWIPIFGFHRDPKHFENPTKFDPERFSDENKSRTTCLSVLVLETALFYHLLLNFEIEPTKSTRVPLKLSAKSITPSPKGDENKRNIKPHTYVPFGAGPRNCIGSRFALLEMKSLFYNLLLNFEIEPTKTTTVPIKLSAKSFNPAPEGAPQISNCLADIGYLAIQEEQLRELNEYRKNN
ncbi:hypothetical protein YQE_03762, partial [Dendroctonus ponderosae]